MAKDKTRTDKPVTEIKDENGEPINLVDDNGQPIKELAFLASLPLSMVKKEEEKYFKANRRLRIVATCFAIAFVCFLGLYVMAQLQYQSKCSAMFNQSMTNAVQLMTTCTTTDYDYDTNYRELAGELNVIRKMAFAVTDNQNQQTTMNNVYYLSIKLPDEYRKYMPDILEGFQYIQDAQDDKGYSILSAALENVDLLNY